MGAIHSVFLSIIRLGLGNQSHIGQWKYSDANSVDWNSLEDIANRQGLSAILVDGVERLSEDKRPPKETLLQWIGNTLQAYEYRFELYQKSISELAGFYNAHGYKMMVIKGFACGLNWSKPEHRPCGDIWQFGKSYDADAVLAKEKGLKIDKSHHHHTVFDWRNFMVENHYDFINVHRHKSNVEFEKVLKTLGQDESHSVEIQGEKVYLPSPNLHALFLLKHMMMHFAAEGITLRHLINWAFFAKAHHKAVDWEWLLDVLDKYGMKDLFNAFNAICVEDLGFEANIFHQVQFNPVTKDRVLKDILTPEFSIEPPK